MFSYRFLALRNQRLLNVTFVLFAVIALWAYSSNAQRRQRSGESLNCQLEAGGESTVVAVAGPQTLRLADGRFVRLAEILVPALPSPTSGFDPSAAAMTYLRTAAVGRKVEVKFGGTQRDRYGVYNAHLYIANEPPLWLQDALVNAGLAQALPQIDNHACSTQLAAAEASARASNRGLWGLAFFKILRASDPRSILNLVQTYQIVEGKSVRATESGGRITVHFSAEGKYGFAATVEPAAKKRFTDKQDPDNWAGLTLRIRGWVERKRGPSISVTLPEQIEFLAQSENAGAQTKEAR